ncbi:MAG: DUF1735 domain-containing protein [Chitinophagaceae bacterium]
MKPKINYSKMYRAIPITALVVTCIFSLSSCLKDTRENLSQSPPLVGFLFPSPGFYPPSGGFVFSSPLAYSSNAQTVAYDSTQAYPNAFNAPLEIELSYTSFPAPYKSAVTATVVVDSTIIAEINAADGSSFLMPPAGSYSLPNNGQVTIQPAQLGKYPVAVVYPTIITSKLDTTQQYLLPLRITTASSGITVASNLNQAAIHLVIQ